MMDFDPQVFRISLSSAVLISLLKLSPVSPCFDIVDSCLLWSSSLLDPSVSPSILSHDQTTTTLFFYNCHQLLLPAYISLHQFSHLFVVCDK